MGTRNLFVVVVLLVVGLCGSAALALDPMGPPTAGLKTGQFSAGAEYSDSRMDIELENGKIIDEIYQHGVLANTTSSKIGSFKIRNLKMHKVYANLGYGVTDNWETFLRLGGMNTEFKGDFFSDESKTYNGDTGFAIGFGTKATFYEEDKLKLGGLFQMSWGSSEAKLSGTNGTDWSESVELNIVEMQIAVGPTYQLMKNVSIYGGPFWHFVNFSDSDLNGNRSVDTDPAQDEQKISSASYDIDDVSYFGGYIGAQIEIAKNTFYSIEYQHTATADAIGMSLSWRF